MIPTKGREKRRNKLSKASKNIERLYREGKCRECSVVVTRMDFAKILGKFTKVKIQYENITNNNSKPKAKPSPTISSPNINNRLKSNENGMVLLHRNAYNQHPVKALNYKKENKNSQQSNNILKENNRLKKSPVVVKDRNSNYNKKPLVSSLKQYGIIFVTPTKINNNDAKIKISLGELLPIIDESILPSVEWCIDYFPKNEEPEEDKVYDRIAAELEDLMYNEKKPDKSKVNVETTENKVDDFPSIMDILNDNTSENISKDNNQRHAAVSKTNLESSDVEAMLLGKSNNTNAQEMEAMDVDSTISNLLNVSVMQGASEDSKAQGDAMNAIDNPQSPSILDEALQGIEEHLPTEKPEKDVKLEEQNSPKAIVEKGCEISKTTAKPMEVDMKLNEELSIPRPDTVTHVVFKKTVNGKCIMSVTCPKNLKYSIELEEKSVELIGAPRFISSLEDLQVLLQIVNESKLNSLYVLH